MAILGYLMLLGVYSSIIMKNKHHVLKLPLILKYVILMPMVLFTSPFTFFYIVGKTIKVLIILVGGTLYTIYLLTKRYLEGRRSKQ